MITAKEIGIFSLPMEQVNQKLKIYRSDAYHCVVGLSHIGLTIYLEMQLFTTRCVDIESFTTGCGG